MLPQQMEKLTMWIRGWAFLFMAIISLHEVPVSQACSCAMMHPQAAFCNADVAMRFVVKDVPDPDYNSRDVYHTYNITKVAVFRNSPTFDQVLTRNEVYTAVQSSMCGVALKPRKKYFVTANVYDGKIHINLCAWVQAWKSIPKRQRRLIKSGYNRFCDKCKITMSADNSSTEKGECVWDTSSPAYHCYQQYALCKSKAGPFATRCRWSYGRKAKQQNDFRNCYKNAMRKH